MAQRCLFSVGKDGLIRKHAIDIDKCLRKSSLSAPFLENWLLKYLDRLIKYFYRIALDLRHGISLTMKVVFCRGI